MVENKNNQIQDNTPAWKVWLRISIPFCIFIGILKGCLNELKGESFWDGFKEDTGWIVSLIIIIAIIVVIVILGAIFGGKNSPRF